jgi:serine/threonine protein kinase
MKSLSACLTSETLIQLGHDELTPAELRAVEDHLSDCELCRNRLGDAETDELWRDQIAPALKSPTDAPRSAHSLELDPLPESSLDSVLKLLGPTDDPQMLGRIGTYEIVGVIGRGGMGVVFKAFDGALNRFVAIKMLLPHLAVSGAARKRFAREGKAAAAVIDDNVLPIYAVAEWQGIPYLVTQYSRSATLQARIADQGPLELKEILRIGMQTARGLAAAHAQGLVHRDIKPSNILLDGAVERAMLTDFGLARAADDASITRTGVIAGTPQYMSPEQARAGTVDGRSDLFGLGCVMYAMCTGRPPFRAESSYAILRLITDHEPKSIREINADIPDWLCGIIAKLMAKDANDRYATASEVAQLLESCLAHLQQPATVPLPLKAQAAVPAKPRTQSASRRWSPRSIAIACGAAALAIFAGVIIVLELNKGTLTITSNVDNVKIKITQGEKIVDELTMHKSAESVRIAAGRYQIEIVGDTDVAQVENGNVTLSRGGTEVVRIVQHPAAQQPSAPKLTGPLGSAFDSATRVQSDEIGFHKLALSDAVGEFNREQQKNMLGKTQPPLTDDEVIASLLWTQDSVFKSLSDEEQKKLKSIYTERVLPAPFRFTVLTELKGVEKERFQVWFIQLTLTRPDGTEFRHNIREQFICERNEFGKELRFNGMDRKRTPPKGWRLLEDVVRSFNESHSRLHGLTMPPVTMEEISSAIRFWKTQRPKFDVTDVEFDQLQQVAIFGYIPPGAELSIITHFEPGDGRKYLIWSLRLHFKRLEAGAPYPMFGDVFRTHYVKVSTIDEGKIAWGPVANNGLQAGVLFESLHGIHGSTSTSESSRGGGLGADLGGTGLGGGGGMSSSRAINPKLPLETQITPTFYFRNTADKHKEASFPNIMTHSYYKKLEATLTSSKQLPVETNKDPAGPVGWLQMPFAFGAQHDIRGLPILLGEGDRGDAESIIRVSKGDKIRVRFTLDNYGDKDAEPLVTDWVEFTVE